MRYTIGLSLCLVALVVLSGCHSFLGVQKTGVRVVVEGGGAFPDSLAGRWKADRDGWEFVIDPDGRITSAVLSLGRLRVVPGRKTTRPTRSGGQGVFVPGPWTVHYQPETNQLTLRIAMDDIQVDMAGTILEGRSMDTFSGAISPTDGVWQTQWTAFNSYTARTPDGQTKDLSTDPTYGETKALTFQRMDPQ